jgi:hypothetical protein
MKQLKHNNIFKIICITLAFAMLANDVSFAADGLRSCLSIPLASNNPARIEALTSEKVRVSFLELIARSLNEGLPVDRTKVLIHELILSKSDPQIIHDVYNFSGLKSGSGAGNPEFILPYAGGKDRLVFSFDKDHQGALIKEFPLGEKTVYAHRVSQEEPQPPDSGQPTPPAIEMPQAEQHNDDEIKPDQARFEGLGDKLKRLLGWLRMRWNSLQKQIEPTSSLEAY